MSEEPSIPDSSEPSEFPAKGHVIEIVTKIEKNLTEIEKESVKNSCLSGEAKVSETVQPKESKPEGKKEVERSSISVCVQYSTENLKSQTPQLVESLILNKNELTQNDVSAPEKKNEIPKNEETRICNIEDVARTPLIEKYCSSMKKCFKKILNKAKTLNNKVHLFGYPCLPYLCENDDEPSTSKIDRKTRVKVRKDKKGLRKRRAGKSITSFGSIGRRRFDPAIFEYPDIEREQRRSRLRPSDFYLLSDDEDPLYAKKYRRSFKSNNLKKLQSFESDLDFYHSYGRVVFLPRPEKRCLVCKSCVRKTRNPYVYNVYENRNFKTDIINYSFKYQECHRKRHRGKESLRKRKNFKGRKIVQTIQCVLAEKNEKTCQLPKKTFGKSIFNRLSKVKCKFRKALKNKES